MAIHPSTLEGPALVGYMYQVAHHASKVGEASGQPTSPKSVLFDILCESVERQDQKLVDAAKEALTLVSLDQSLEVRFSRDRI